MYAVSYVAWTLGSVLALTLTVVLARRLIRGLRAGKRRLAYLHVHTFGACPALAQFGPARSSFLCSRPDGPARGLSPFELTELIFESLPSSEPARQNLDTLPGDVRSSSSQPR